MQSVQAVACSAERCQGVAPFQRELLERNNGDAREKSEDELAHLRENIGSSGNLSRGVRLERNRGGRQ